MHWRIKRWLRSCFYNRNCSYYYFKAVVWILTMWVIPWFLHWLQKPCECITNSMMSVWFFCELAGTCPHWVVFWFWGWSLTRKLLSIRSRGPSERMRQWMKGSLAWHSNLRVERTDCDHLLCAMLGITLYHTESGISMKIHACHVPELKKWFCGKKYIEITYQTNV